MPIRGSPNGASHPRPQAGRDRPEWVVAINRNAWSQSIGTAGREGTSKSVLGMRRPRPRNTADRPKRRACPREDAQRKTRG